MQIWAVICGWWLMWWGSGACCIPIRPGSWIHRVIQFQYISCSNDHMGVQYSILTTFFQTRMRLQGGLMMSANLRSKFIKERRKTSISFMSLSSKSRATSTIPSRGNQIMVSVTELKLRCLTLRRLMSYIYGAPILDVSRSHTTTQHSR